ncbi:MAG: phosphatidate cytidylyltransferase [Pseudomonadota bacterium]
MAGADTSSAPPGRWDDLRLRLVSGVVMVVVGFTCVYFAGLYIFALVAVLVAAMSWELTRMLAPDLDWVRTWTLVGLAVGALSLAAQLPFPARAPLLIAASGLALFFVSGNRRPYFLFYAAALLTAMGVFDQRDHFGLVWMMWLVLVVVQSDVMGYFAGRTFGGAKFWPSLSPKKTWSGIIAGWVGAAILGGIFGWATGAGTVVAVFSVILCYAAQMGDIAESWLKRKAGVKDSSNLIPGHGGVWDRFDGLVGATLALLIIEQITNFPPRLPGPL